MDYYQSYMFDHMDLGGDEILSSQNAPRKWEKAAQY